MKSQLPPRNPEHPRGGRWEWSRNWSGGEGTKPSGSGPCDCQPVKAGNHKVRGTGSAWVRWMATKVPQNRARTRNTITPICGQSHQLRPRGLFRADLWSKGMLPVRQNFSKTTGGGTASGGGERGGRWAESSQNYPPRPSSPILPQPAGGAGTWIAGRVGEAADVRGAFGVGDGGRCGGGGEGPGAHRSGPSGFLEDRGDPNTRAGVNEGPGPLFPPMGGRPPWGNCANSSPGGGHTHPPPRGTWWTRGTNWKESAPGHLLALPVHPSVSAAEVDGGFLTREAHCTPICSRSSSSHRVTSSSTAKPSTITTRMAGSPSRSCRFSRRIARAGEPVGVADQ